MKRRYLRTACGFLLLVLVASSVYLWYRWSVRRNAYETLIEGASSFGVLYSPSDWTSHIDYAFQKVVGCPLFLQKSTQMVISDRPLTGEMAKCIAVFDDVERLGLVNSTITEEAGRNLAGHPGLKRVELGGDSVAPANIAYLSGLPNLQSLSIFKCTLSEHSAEAIGSLNNLQNLSINKCTLSEHSAEAIGSLKSVTTCTIQDCVVSNASLAALLSNPHLRELNLWYIDPLQFPDEMFERLKGRQIPTVRIADKQSSLVVELDANGEVVIERKTKDADKNGN